VTQRNRNGRDGHELLKFRGSLLTRTRSQVSLRSNIDRSEIDEFREGGSVP
jgi:hypothetical protein